MAKKRIKNETKSPIDSDSDNDFYLSDGFPTTALMILLILTLPLVRLKDDFFEKLKKLRWRRKLVMLVWLIAFIVTAVPMSEYARNSVFDALHPYAKHSYHMLGADLDDEPGDGLIADKKYSHKKYRGGGKSGKPLMKLENEN